MQEGEAIKVFNNNEQSSATQFRLKDTKKRKEERKTRLQG